MRPINFDFKNLCQRNKDGSYATQADRFRSLQLIGSQLHELGFKGLRARNIGTKHVCALVAHWKEQGLSTGTIKNRMAHLRWVGEKTGAKIHADNARYNIEQRESNNQVSKARYDVPEIENKHVQYAWELQRAFGLRREESLKFQPHFADRGDKIFLKGSWCKNGRERAIPITNQNQRDLLEKLKNFTQYSLIPREMSFKTFLSVYKQICKENEIVALRANEWLLKGASHGFRHAYAQQRYFELTGCLAPNQSGVTRKMMTDEQKAQDLQARQIISTELGHNRIDVVARYIG